MTGDDISDFEKDLWVLGVVLLAAVTIGIFLAVLTADAPPVVKVILGICAGFNVVWAVTFYRRFHR